jgi:hypothetical protein
MSEVFDEGAVDSEALRGDANATGPAELLEVIAPFIYIGRVPDVSLLAIGYHVRIIII